MMYKIEPLYYDSPNYKKKDGEYFINLKFIVNITITERVARIYIVNDPTNEFTVSKIQAMDMLQVIQTMNKDKEWL